MKQSEYDAIQAKIAELTATLKNAEIEPESTGWAGREDMRHIRINDGWLDVWLDDSDRHRHLFEVANKFTDTPEGRAKAEEINAAQLCYRLLKRFSDENGGSGAWYIRFDVDEPKATPCYNVRTPLDVRFKTQEACQQAIDKYRTEIMAAMGV